MYKAKELGPGQFRFFDQDMLNASVWRLELETQLRQASAQQQFTLVYQPKVEVNNQKPVGLEALIRWNNGQALVSPAVFLPIAEDIGLMESISVSVKGENGEFTFDAQIRIDTPNEFSYFSDGGILQYVLRSLNKKA